MCIRDSNYGEWDSWDLALQQIYKWYEDNKDKKNVNDNRSIIKLFSNKSNKSKNIDYADAVSTTAKWLSSFECWENFISMNYLEPFVTKELEPKMFFANHSLDYPIPKNKKEFKSFFINVTRAIKKRNKLIYNNIKNTSEYKKIKEITKLQENYVNLKGYKNRTKLREIFMDSISPRQVRDRLKRFKNNKLENSSVFVSWLGSIISVIFGFVIFISSIFSGLYLSLIHI